MKTWIVAVAVAVVVLCAGPVWAAKPSQVKTQKLPATIEGVIDPIVTVSPTVLTLKSGEQGTINWTIQVPATEPDPATDITWTWPHPEGFLPIEGWCEKPGYTIPGYSITNVATVTWDGGGYAESQPVTVQVVPVDVPAMNVELFMDGGLWNAWIDEIKPGNLATVAITVAAP